MNKFASLLATTLLLASPFARAAADNPDDLRYCLDLPSDQQIAKCAGEIYPDKKGMPLSKKEVESILNEGKAREPAGTGGASSTPAPADSKPGKDLSPEKTEPNTN